MISFSVHKTVAVVQPVPRCGFAGLRSGEFIAVQFLGN